MPVLTLAEAKAHLNITVTTYDAEVQSFLDSAEAVIADRCGPLGPVATTARVLGGSAGLVLPVTPALSLTSVTPVGGSALVLADLYLSTASGVVSLNAGGTFGSTSYDVVYQSGRVAIPLPLVHAVRELLRHFWTSSQRGGSKRPGSADLAISPASFLLPYEVQSAIEPYTQPGFA